MREENKMTRDLILESAVNRRKYRLQVYIRLPHYTYAYEKKTHFFCVIFAK